MRRASAYDSMNLRELDVFSLVHEKGRMDGADDKQITRIQELSF